MITANSGKKFVSIATIVPTGKHIFSFGTISLVLSVVCIMLNQEHAKDTDFI